MKELRRRFGMYPAAINPLNLIRIIPAEGRDLQYVFAPALCFLEGVERDHSTETTFRDHWANYRLT